MAEYKLYISADKGESYQEADIQENPRLNFQFYDLENLNIVVADYSREWSLPKTIKNNDIFKDVQFFEKNATRKTAYKILNCILLCNNHTIIAEGILTILEITDRYKVFIQSSKGNLLNTLKNISLEPKYLREEWEKYNANPNLYPKPFYIEFIGTNTKNAIERQTKENIIYPATNPHTFSTSNTTRYTAFTLPLVRTSYLLTNMLAWKLRYHCELSSNAFKLPLSPTKKDSTFMGLVDTEYTNKNGIQYSSLSYDIEFKSDFVPKTENTFSPIDGSQFTRSWRRMEFSQTNSVKPYIEAKVKKHNLSYENGIETFSTTFKHKTEIALKVVFSSIPTSHFNPKLIQRVGENEQEIGWQSISGNTYVSKKKTIQAGQEFMFAIRQTPTAESQGFVTPGPTAKTTITFDALNLDKDAYLETTTKTPLGSSIDLSANLGYKTALDLFKAVIQSHELLVKVNEGEKIIDFITIGEFFEESRENAVSWGEETVVRVVSRKFKSETEIGKTTFVEFEQDNKIVYKTSNFTGEIKDETIKEEATYITPQVAQSEWKESFIDEIVKQDYKIEKAKFPQLGILSDQTQRIEYKFNKDSKTHAIPPQKDNKRIMPFYPELYKYSAGYEQLFRRIFNDYLFVELEVILSFKDIEKLKARPTQIYLEKFGAYFHLLKVTNFEEGLTCKAELIRID